jgi:hypothetical protein
MSFLEFSFETRYTFYGWPRKGFRGRATVEGIACFKREFEKGHPWGNCQDEERMSFLEFSFETRYTFYGCSAPEPLSWQYSSTSVTTYLLDQRSRNPRDLTSLMQKLFKVLVTDVLEYCQHQFLILTISSRMSFLEFSFETRYTFYGCSAPEPLLPRL